MGDIFITEQIVREILAYNYHPDDVGIVYQSHSFLNSDDVVRIVFKDQRLELSGSVLSSVNPTQYLIVSDVYKHPAVLPYLRNRKIKEILK